VHPKDVVDGLPKWKKILFATIVTLSPVFALIAIEGGVRVYYWARYGVPGKHYGIWRPDPELGAIHSENAYNSMGETNDKGFRNREDVYDPKPEGSLRVIAYGGSTTFCYQLHNDEAWPARLEQLMRSSRPGGERDQVLNGGAVMWSIGQIYARAKRDLPVLRPDYVLIYSGVNEYWNTLLLAGENQQMGQLVKEGRFGIFTRDLDQVKWINRELFTFKIYQRYFVANVQDLLASVVGSREPTYPAGPEPATLENYLHVLKDLIQLVKSSGGTPVFVVEISGMTTPKTQYLTSYSRAGAPEAERVGAIVIDPSPILEGNPGGPMSLFENTGVHYSVAGARKLAAHLFARLFGGQAHWEALPEHLQRALP